MESNGVGSPDPQSVGRKPPREPRKHHYVPVFYQKNFTNDSGLLWVYDRALGTLKELHPQSICFEKDLYAVKPEGKPLDMRVETEVLQVIDCLGSTGIKSFIAGQPSRKAEQATAFFMAFQWTRVPTMSRDFRTTYAKLIEELTRVAFANVGRARSLIKQHAQETADELEVTPESMVKAVKEKQFEITATETAFLTSMMEQASSLTRTILQLDWEVLVASAETGFVICDCPVVIVPPRGNNQVGFVVPGSAKYLPLSRRLCLRLGEPGKRRRLRSIDKESVRVVNLNIAANSERFIMGPSKTQIENVVFRSSTQGIEFIPRFTVETLDPTEDGSPQKLSSQPRRYFYPKSGAIEAP